MTIMMIYNNDLFIEHTKRSINKNFFFEVKNSTKIFRKRQISIKLITVFHKFKNKFINVLIKKGKKNLIKNSFFFFLKKNLKKHGFKIDNIFLKLLKYFILGLRFKKIYKSGKKYLVPYPCYYFNKQNYLFFKGYIAPNYFKNRRTATLKNLLTNFFIDLKTVAFQDTKKFKNTGFSIFKNIKYRYLKNLRNSHLYLRYAFKNKKKKTGLKKKLYKIKHRNSILFLNGILRTKKIWELFSKNEIF